MVTLLHDTVEKITLRTSGWTGGRRRGVRPRWDTLGVEGAWVVARIFTRVGACAEELRLMGVERAEMFANGGIVPAGVEDPSREMFPTPWFRP